MTEFLAPETKKLESREKTPASEFTHAPGLELDYAPQKNRPANAAPMPGWSSGRAATAKGGALDLCPMRRRCWAGTPT
jgi:hypothetical protein